MKHLLAIVATVATVVFALAATTAQEKPAARRGDAVEATLIANEQALYEAVAGGNKAAFLSLAASDGVWTTRHGFVPMNLLVDGLGSFKLAKWSIVNPRVTRLGEDSAMVTYAWKGAGTYGDQPLAQTALAVTIWTRRSGKWLAIHHQETELVPN